jgi:hypothetical protein
MAEWGSFREREKMLGLFSHEDPRGLVYPIRFADGDYFHPDAKVTQCKRDFSRLNYPDDAFRQSAKYMEFHDLVREMSEELVRLIQTIPPWKEDFPVVEPAPLPAPILPRPVL